MAPTALRRRERRQVPGTLPARLNLILPGLPLDSQCRAKDVYGSYFFFCLTCRLPTLLMLLSTCMLVGVLVALAYPVLPSAVLPMFFIAGLLGTLQYLVYGAHRGINLVIWLVRGAWRACAGAVARPSPAQTQTQTQHHNPPTVQMGVSVCPPHSHSHNHIHNQSQPPAAPRIQDGRGEGVRIEMPVPCSSPGPTPGLGSGAGAAHAKLVMVWAESAVRRLCCVRGAVCADESLLCVGRGRGGSVRGFHGARWPLVCASWQMERKFIEDGVPANSSCRCRSLVTGHCSASRSAVFAEPAISGLQ